MMTHSVDHNDPQELLKDHNDRKMGHSENLKHSNIVEAMQL